MVSLGMMLSTVLRSLLSSALHISGETMNWTSKSAGLVVTAVSAFALPAGDALYLAMLAVVDMYGSSNEPTPSARSPGR